LSGDLEATAKLLRQTTIEKSNINIAASSQRQAAIGRTLIAIDPFKAEVLTLQKPILTFQEEVKVNFDLLVLFHMPWTYLHTGSVVASHRHRPQSDRKILEFSPQNDHDVTRLHLFHSIGHRQLREHCQRIVALTEAPSANKGSQTNIDSISLPHQRPPFSIVE
jgi:hypothetical protein